ncbi:MAG TPA: hypothetical protein VGD04_08665 [Methylophilus sp.]
MLKPIANKIKAMLVPDKFEQHQLIAQHLQPLNAESLMKACLQWFVDLREHQNLTPMQQLKCIYVIDELSQKAITEMTEKRMRIKLYNRDKGAEMDALMNPYYRHLFLAYWDFVELVAVESKVFKLDSEALSLLVCRTLNAANNMAMWRYFDDFAAPADTWSKIHYLFKMAEKSTLMNERVMLYPESSQATDFASLMVGGLMLSTLQKGNYNPVEIHIVSKLMADWVTSSTFETHYVENKYQFFVNLNKDDGAEHIRAFEKHADYRYWRTDYLAERIEAILVAISTGVLPKTHPIKEYANTRILYTLLKKLNQDWSPKHYKRQRRAAVRTKLDQQLRVTTGLPQICKQLNAFNKRLTKQPASAPVNNYDFISFDEAGKVLMGLDEWALLDISEYGFGVNLGRAPSAWVGVGKLVGFPHPTDTAQYVIAEIKSIKKQKNGSYRAGLQSLCLQSLALRLIKVDSAQVELSKGFYLENEDDLDHYQNIDCVWIPANELHLQLKSSVIIPFSEYQRNREFKIDLHGENKRLVLGHAIEVQTEWVRAAIAAIH